MDAPGIPAIALALAARPHHLQYTILGVQPSWLEVMHAVVWWTAHQRTKKMAMFDVLFDAVIAAADGKRMELEPDSRHHELQHLEAPLPALCCSLLGPPAMLPHGSLPLPPPGASCVMPAGELCM